MRSEFISEEIEQEYQLASLRFPKFNSAHEGYAVIKEELDELWDEVKKREEHRSIKKMRREALQVGAMAERFIIDVCCNGE